MGLGYSDYILGYRDNVVWYLLSVYWAPQEDEQKNEHQRPSQLCKHHLDQDACGA